MTYKIAKLVSDYVSPGIYVNRLELGDSGLNGPVDLRFIGEPGWIENAHSVFFKMDGKTYDGGDTGSLISTSDTGDLVFFDPSNSVGRTLSQLYGGGGAGLWEDMGTYVRLVVADDVDFRAKNILHLASAQSEFAAGMTIFDSAGATAAYLGTDTYSFSAHKNIYMNSSYKIQGLVAGTVNGDSVRYEQLLWTDDTSYVKLSTPRAVNMQDEKIINLFELIGSDNDPATPMFDISASSGADLRLIAPTSCSTWIYSGNTAAIGATPTYVGIHKDVIMAAGKYIDMNGGDLVNVDELKAKASAMLNITGVNGSTLGLELGTDAQPAILSIYSLISGSTPYAAFDCEVSLRTHSLVYVNNLNLATAGSGKIRYVKELRFTPGSAPSTYEGATYYDSAANKLKFYNGSAWETISSS